MKNEKEPTIRLKGKDVSAIVFWLSLLADKEWRGGSLDNIEEVYNRLNEFINFRHKPKKWIWKEETSDKQRSAK